MSSFKQIISLRRPWAAAAILALFIALASAALHKPAASRTAPLSCQCSALTIPFDSIVPGDSPLFGSQPNADCFGWWEFISLNWPTTPGAGFGDSTDLGPVQWETFITAEELYPPDGAAPPPWGGSNLLPLSANVLKLDKRLGTVTKLLSATSKFNATGTQRFGPQSDQEAAPEFGPNWLGAQNGTNIWYEIRENQDIYNFVVKNKYYNANNQLAAIKKGKPIVFPMGSYPNGPTGAIELKAAWMEITDTGNPKWNRYKRSNAAVVDPVTGAYRFTQVALVGLHILHKTESQPTWVWATFEHIDNVPDGSGAGDTVAYNFYNPNCQPVTVTPKDSSSPVTVTCTPNTSPPYYLTKGGPAPVPIQITRLTPIDNNAQAANSTMQAAIAAAYPGSVWQNYQLVNVIWSSDPADNPRRPDTVPIYLSGMQPTIPVANATLESYAQTTTCTGCHQYASIAPTLQDTTPNWAADFSFAIGTAGYPGKTTAKKKKQ
ncbi:hypothetical protein [uncultured Chitinophaga sp.]|jgi:hypothetical protein|uniref:hypothetical protein n=1 Tax=uncultured Chitinophaga sp. TaxID=339340 RepID=UPI0026221C24|nr:hypothetical protein [uncultured Chitinophaga sp.]